MKKFSHREKIITCKECETITSIQAVSCKEKAKKQDWNAEHECGTANQGIRIGDLMPDDL